MYILPVRTKGDYLCVDTVLFNALNDAGIYFIWDYDNKGLKFENKRDFDEAVRLQNQLCSEPVIKEPKPVSKIIKKETRRSRLF